MMHMENFEPFILVTVLLRNFTGSAWRVVGKTGPVSFHVLLEDGRSKCCHQDQLCHKITADGPQEMSEIPLTLLTPIAETVEPESSNSHVRTLTLSPTSPDSIDTSDSNVRHYPCHQRKPRETWN